VFAFILYILLLCEDHLQLFSFYLTLISWFSCQV